MDLHLKKIIFSILLFSFLIPSLVEAIVIPNPLDATTFEELVEKLIDLIFWVAVAIAPLMIIISGFYFLTAAGDLEKIRKAKNIILWTAVGLAIVLLAKGIISVIRQVIGG